jgi:Uma2 family endonuclease
VFYVQAEHIPSTGIPDTFWEIAPDVAVEVVLPNESAEEMRDKVRDYLAAGTLLVWVIYPHSQEVIVHTPDGMARTYGATAVLENFDILPGLKRENKGRIKCNHCLIFIL